MLWEPCLETYFLGTCFLGTLLGNLFLGTLLGNLAPEPVLGNPFLGTRSWEPVLGNLAWEPCSWEPGNFGNPDFGSSDLLRDLYYGWRHQAYSTLLGEKIDQSFIFNLIYGNLNADIIAFAASLFLMGITLLLCFLLEQCSSAKNDAGNSQVSWSSRGGHCPPPLIASNLSHLGSQLLSHWEAKMTSFLSSIVHRWGFKLYLTFLLQVEGRCVPSWPRASRLVQARERRQQLFQFHKDALEPSI